MFENAKIMFDHISQVENENLGVNLFLLRLLKRYHFIDDNFTRKSDDELKQIDFRKAMTRPYVNFEEYLEDLASLLQNEASAPKDSYGRKVENQVDIDSSSKSQQERATLLQKLYQFVLLFNKKNSDYYSICGRSNYLLHIGNIENGLDHYERNKHAFPFDNTFKYYHISKIKDYSLYATQGPQNKTISGFLTEILNLNNSHDLDFKHVVALGNKEGSKTDFIDYYDEPKPVKFYLPNNEVVTIVTQSEAQSLGDSYNTHKLTFNIESNQKELRQKSILVHNIFVSDGNPIQLYTDELINFNDDLLTALKENEPILVHCHAGLGRTGQVITQLIALHENVIQDIFSTDHIPTMLAKIKDFIEMLRIYRPGFLLEPQQVYYFLEQCVNYLQMKESALEVHHVHQQENTVVSNFDEEFKVSQEALPNQKEINVEINVTGHEVETVSQKRKGTEIEREIESEIETEVETKIESKRQIIQNKIRRVLLSDLFPDSPLEENNLPKDQIKDYTPKPQ